MFASFDLLDTLLHVWYQQVASRKINPFGSQVGLDAVHCCDLDDDQSCCICFIILHIAFFSSIEFDKRQNNILVSNVKQVRSNHVSDVVIMNRSQ